jgi:hypothetical protein
LSQRASNPAKHIIQDFTMLSTKEIATALNATEAAVEKAIVGMGAINPSMLPEIKSKIEGGKLAPKDAPAPLATTTEKSTKARRTTKMKKADEALAVRRDAAAIEVKKEIEATTQPQVLESIDANASALSIGDEIAASLQTEIMGDIQQVAQMMTPELRTLKTITAAQGLSAKISAKMQGEGLTVDAIIAAAIPRAGVRKTLNDLFDAELEAIEVVY